MISAILYYNETSPYLILQVQSLQLPPLPPGSQNTSFSPSSTPIMRCGCVPACACALSAPVFRCVPT